MKYLWRRVGTVLEVNEARASVDLQRWNEFSITFASTERMMFFSAIQLIVSNFSFIYKPDNVNNIKYEAMYSVASIVIL